MSINLSQAIPLSKDISNVDNEMFTMEISDEEISEAVKQISHALGSDGN